MAGDDEGLALDKRKAALVLGLAAALAAGIFALIGSFAHWGELLNGVENADKSWLPVLLLGEVLAYVGYVLAYRDLACVDGGPKLRYWTIVRVVAIGFGAFVVGSAAGGLAVDFWALRRAGERSHEAVRRVLALNTLEWAWLGAFAAVAGAVALALRGGAAPIDMSLAWIVAVPACALAALWVSAPERGERLARLPEHKDDAPAGDGRLARLRHWLATSARIGFAESVGGLLLVRRILAHPLRYPAGFLGYPIYWVGDLLTLYAAVRAFGHGLSPDLLVLAYATAYVVTALPLPAGGAGGVDAALALTLHAMGVPLAGALLAAAVYRVFAFWLPIGPALALLPTVPRLRQDLRHVAEASA